MCRFYWYKHEVMQLLLKMEYQRSMFAQREKMLANLKDQDKADDMPVSNLLPLCSLPVTSALSFGYFFFFFHVQVSMYVYCYESLWLCVLLLCRIRWRKTGWRTRRD